MGNELTIQKTADVESIKNRIYEIRGLRVMLDRDLAELYEVSQLKHQVRRDIERFPEDYMFELTHDEQTALRCQNGTIKNGHGLHNNAFGNTLQPNCKSKNLKIFKQNN